MLILILFNISLFTNFNKCDQTWIIIKLRKDKTSYHTIHNQISN